MAAAPVLTLRAVEFSYGRRRILSSVDLDVVAKEHFVLIGPGGAGKSTLLRLICGLQQSTGDTIVRGRLFFRGRAIGPGNRPILVGQRPPPLHPSVFEFLTGRMANRYPGLTMEDQMKAAGEALESAGLQHLRGALEARLEELEPADLVSVRIARALARDPCLLCLDEPTAGLNGAAAQKIRDLIAAEKAKRAVLLVTHHLGEAEKLGDRIALLAGGRIVEQGSAATFFDRPTTEAGRQFVRSGSCGLPSPDAEPMHLSPENRAPKTMQPVGRPFIPDSYGPKGFRWLLDGRLGGTSPPGLLGNLDADLASLRRVGTTLLVTLTEAPAVTYADAARFGMRQRWFPLADPACPDPEEAIRILAEAEREMQAGGAVVYHCGADLRLTGVMLASHLVIRDMSVPHALAFARRRNREWVQSLNQEACLWDFELFLALKLDGSKDDNTNSGAWHGAG